MMSIFLCLWLVVSVVAQTNVEWRLVNTTQGPVRGYKDPDGGLFAFYNIPYATVPTGENRFKGPLPPPVWFQTYEAIDRGVLCLQTIYGAGLPPNKIMQENCLIASIYVPDTEDRNLPVVVYVHGGAFQIGFGDGLTPKNLVRTRNVIVITFNYRLSIHGFLCLGTEAVPGNAGLKDQVALLRWVKRNIAYFGGNSEDITIAGYSAGGASVDLIMLSKSAENLFNKVIPESGSNVAAIAFQAFPLENAKNYALQLNFTDVNNITHLENFYKTAPFEVLLGNIVFDNPNGSFGFSPCIERDVGAEIFLDNHPLNIIQSGNYNKVPLLYGFTNMEGLLRLEFFNQFQHKMNEKFSDFLPTDLHFENEEQKNEIAQAVKEFYFADQPVNEGTILAYIDYFSDSLFTYPTLRSIKYHLEAGHDQIYLYEYSFVDDQTPLVPFTNISGAQHCAQTFAVMDGENNITEEYRQMKEIMRTLWSNFIVTGQPVPQDSQLPAWPAMGSDRMPYMSLGQTLELKGLLLQERYLFWEDIYQRYYRAPIPPPNHNSAAFNNFVKWNTLFTSTLIIMYISFNH